MACMTLKNYFKYNSCKYILHITIYICLILKGSSFRSHDWTRDKYFDISFDVKIAMALATHASNIKNFQRIITDGKIFERAIFPDCAPIHSSPKLSVFIRKVRALCGKTL